jgi:hypothetical protein
MRRAPVRLLEGRPRPGAAGAWRRAPAGAHEWVSFPDPDEERTWLFDVTFLKSNWTCIFGCGCQGVLTGPSPELVQGCCSYGAHLTGAKDARRVEQAAARLSPEQWQFWRQGRPKAARDGAKGSAKAAAKAGAKGTRLRIFARDASGQLTTRLVRGACIFLNRPGFPGGPGCALHRAALERGEPPLRSKPDVCWQLPLRREDEVGDDGHVTSVIRQWDRRHWGEGGFEFAWWCTEAPDAFVGDRPVYRAMRDELVELVGERIYRRLVRYLEARAGAMAPSAHPSEDGASGPSAARRATPLPHPALRRR